MAARVGRWKSCGEVPESSRMYLDFFVDLLIYNGYAPRALKKGPPFSRKIIRKDKKVNKKDKKEEKDNSRDGVIP